MSQFGQRGVGQHRRKRSQRSEVGGSTLIGILSQIFLFFFSDASPNLVYRPEIILINSNINATTTKNLMGFDIIEINLVLDQKCLFLHTILFTHNFSEPKFF